MKAFIDKYLGAFLVWLLVAMTVDVLWGVFTRYVLGGQASWTEELARFMLIWLGVLGAAYASGQRMHLAIDLIQPKLETSNQKRLIQVIASLIALFALCVLLIGGLRLVYITHILEQRSPALQLPMTIVYGVVPISGLLILYYQMLRIRNPLN